ncbi:hypothetical protein LJC06_01415 [Bacteroidales bacterium OttesenSCG-928-I14]|nr:hypothetical protein [Bacteroidales bacterium OttesenSCG-928-I14]
MKKKIIKLIIGLCALIFPLLVFYSYDQMEEFETDEFSNIEYYNSSFSQEDDNLIVRLFRSLFNKRKHGYEDSSEEGDEGYSAANLSLQESSSNHGGGTFTLARTEINNNFQSKKQASSQSYEVYTAFSASISSGGGRRTSDGHSSNNSLMAMSPAISGKQYAPKGLGPQGSGDPSVSPGDIGDQDIPNPRPTPVGDGLLCFVVFISMFIVIKKIRTVN